MPEDAITIGGVDLTDPETYAHGMPHEVFAALRRTRPGGLAPARRHRILGADRLRRGARGVAGQRDVVVADDRGVLRRAPRPRTSTSWN